MSYLAPISSPKLHPHLVLEQGKSFKRGLIPSSADPVPALLNIPSLREPTNESTKVGVKKGFLKRLKDMNPFANNASAAGCCTVVSLDEASNALDHVYNSGMQHHDAPVMLPKTKAELIATPIISGVCAAGMKIAVDIIRYQNAVIRDLKRAITGNQKTIQEKGNTVERQARSRFLQKNLSEARFQLWVAGATSGIGSFAVLLGQFVMAVSPIGPLLLTGVGYGHMHNSYREIKTIKHRLALAAQDKNITEQHYLRKKLRQSRFNLAAFSFYTAGAAALTALSTSMWGATIATGAIAPLSFAALGILGVGIIGTVVFNNILTSKRFSASIPKAIASKPDLRRIEVLNNLNTAAHHRQIAKNYRDHVFRSRALNGKRWQAKLLHGALRTLNKVAMYLTLAVVPGPFNQNKQRIKELSTRWVSQSDSQRLGALAALASDPNKDIAMVKAPRHTKDRHQALRELLQTLLTHTSRGQIAKLLAKKVLRPKAGEIRPRERENFDFTLTEQENGGEAYDLAEGIDLLKTLAAYKACCPGDYEATVLFQALLSQTEKVTPSQADSGATASNKPDMLAMLHESIDQYLLYQLRNTAKENACAYTEYLGAFREVEAAV